MASGRLLDNRIIDKLSVNKSNKSDEKTNTEFDDNMANFLGTWVATSDRGSETVRTFEKISPGNYKTTSDTYLNVNGEKILTISSIKKITKTSINNCESIESYNELRYLVNSVPQLGVPEPTFPYYGSISRYTLTEDKSKLHVSNILSVDEKLNNEFRKKYPVQSNAFFPIENIVGNMYYFELSVGVRQ